MNSNHVVILSPGPFAKQELHDPKMAESLIGLVVKAEDFEMREQGNLFTGFSPKPKFYLIAVEDLLEALNHLPEPEALNYWLDFWVKKMVYLPFAVPLGPIREATSEELFGI